MTPMTREGVNDPSKLSAAGLKAHYYNGKPFRTKAQKAEARRKAYRTENGTWHSPAPTSHHPMER